MLLLVITYLKSQSYYTFLMIKENVAFYSKYLRFKNQREIDSKRFITKDDHS